MRNISLLSILLFSIFAFQSCKNSKEESKKDFKELENTHIVRPQMSMSKSDTAEVRQLVETFLDNLQNNRYEDAVSMLHYLNKDSIENLSSKKIKAQINVLRSVRGIKYTIDEMRFLKETDSQVKYTATLFEKEADDPRPNKVSFIIKPVRRSGKWYLTMADTETDTNRTEIKN